jgi:F-type H+-transporting ATPase subunit b
MTKIIFSKEKVPAGQPGTFLAPSPRFFEKDKATIMMPLSVFASGGSLIDLDATFFIQLGIFAVLFFLLRSLLFAPVLRLIEARRIATQGAGLAAAELKAKALQLRAHANSSLEEARSSAMDARAKIVEEARKQAAEIVRQARESSSKSTESARAERDRALETVRISLLADVDALAGAAIFRILGRRP